MNKSELELIRVCDQLLCSSNGMPAKIYNSLSTLHDDPEIAEILKDIKETDDQVFFPEWHPGIENILRVDCGSRAEFLQECYQKECPF